MLHLVGLSTYWWHLHWASFTDAYKRKHTDVFLQDSEGCKHSIYEHFFHGAVLTDNTNDKRINKVLRFGDRIGHKHQVKVQVVSVAHKLGVSLPIMANWSLHLKVLYSFNRLNEFTWCTNSLTFNNRTLCPHCIYVFCIYLRTNSDLCHLQHKLIGF